MARRITKAQGKEWLKLLEECLEENADFPQEAGRYPDQLLELQEFLID